MRTAPRSLAWFLVLVALLQWAMIPGLRAQLSEEDDEKLRFLADPDAAQKKKDADKDRPPVSFFRSQVAPSDVLPFAKANHWSTFILDLKSNAGDLQGSLQTEPLKLLGMPQEVIYGRDARLVKDQRTNLNFQVMCTSIPKEVTLELISPGSLRVGREWQASLMPLPPHQMLVMILTKNTTSEFTTWNRLAAMAPFSVQREGPGDEYDARRYYRIIVPTEPDKFYLSSNPLVWSTISHVVWDSIPPDVLSVSQQQAMLDWLHWGGQLILCGGAGATSSLFRESFLAPYMPAERTGENQALKADDLDRLSGSYLPPFQMPRPGPPGSPEVESFPMPGLARKEQVRLYRLRYQKALPIVPGPNAPIYLAGLKPRPGATTVPLGDGSPHLLAAETRVGRGRITMLSINPNDPALVAWRGLDTLIRRVILRRPEEPFDREPIFDARINQPLDMNILEGPDLSWYRIASRDGLGEPIERPVVPGSQEVFRPIGFGATKMTRPVGPPVAEWLDPATLPRLSRDLLEQASGISIPSSRFVLKVIAAYILALLPLNWLFCRFVLRRKEWCWFFIPILSIGFAIGVERMAAFDVGYDSSCDEIDLLEIHGEYGRAHLSRFAALYSTGRGNFSLSFPGEPTALALPLDNGRSIGGEDISTSSWQSYPVPTLSDFSVQPRSLGMVRAEQMLDLGGGVSLESDGSGRRLLNRTGLELRDAVLIEFKEKGQRVEQSLGTIAAGASVDLVSSRAADMPGKIAGFEGPDPTSFLGELRTPRDSRPENAGEIRLVAWTPNAVGGMKIEPDVDRRRGFTAVLAHLRFGLPPDPGGRRYNALAGRPAETPDDESGPDPDLKPSARDGRGPAGKTRLPKASEPGARTRVRIQPGLTDLEE